MFLLSKVLFFGFFPPLLALGGLVFRILLTQSK